MAKVEESNPSWICDHSFKPGEKNPYLCADCNLGEAAHEKTDHVYDVSNNQYRCPDCVTLGINPCTHQGLDRVITSS